MFAGPPTRERPRAVCAVLASLEMRMRGVVLTLLRSNEAPPMDSPVQSHAACTPAAPITAHIARVSGRESMVRGQPLPHAPSRPSTVSAFRCTSLYGLSASRTSCSRTLQRCPLSRRQSERVLLLSQKFSKPGFFVVDSQPEKRSLRAHARRSRYAPLLLPQGLHLR